ncbi:hypothetical protein X801_02371 [Opisthorchis viverrini]|uniref:Deltamethrin resistance protein prag01 domain-containing protein n=1 Tax=Opisthorchis viverrini TaxID=6198 RepID=A0A1S8X4S7_OPIVI|nr:hypothetical protein X801_02371 [Opisthorchis viverrini]
MPEYMSKNPAINVSKILSSDTASHLLYCSRNKGPGELLKPNFQGDQSPIALHCSGIDATLPVVLGVANVRHHGGHVPMRFPNGTYDEIPIPSGDWAKTYKERNAFYNQFMVGWTLCTLVLAVIAYRVADVHKYSLSPSENTEEGLKFMKPDKEALKYILEN